MPTSEPVSVRSFVESDVEPIRSIIERAYADGELVGFHRSEVREWLRSVPDDGDGTVVAEQAGRVIGFLSTGADGLIVSPEHRRRGAGSALVRAAVQRKADLELSQWSGSDETAAFLESVGFRFDHRLLRLLRSGSQRPASPAIPVGFSIERYDHGAFEAYFSLLTTSFADHPTPLHLDEVLVRAVHSRPEFDPARIALITIEGDIHRPVAFVRLRMNETESGEQRGVIAHLGVLPEYRGRGFARQLLRWGVCTLLDSGAKKDRTRSRDHQRSRSPALLQRGFRADSVMALLGFQGAPIVISAIADRLMTFGAKTGSSAHSINIANAKSACNHFHNTSRT